MRKSTLALVAFWALCATFVSCSKDESVIRFKASCERSTAKTDLNANANGYYLTWASNDQIKVYGDNDSCVLTTNSTGTTATFTGTHEGEFHANHDGHTYNEQHAGHGHYYAAYPVSQWSMDHDGDHYYYRLRLPENQTYKANNVENYPMFAVCEESASNIEFKNVCGILEINVSGAPTGADAGAQVTAIQISAEQPLCGDFVVATFTDDGQPFIHEYTEVGNHFHYNTVGLRCPTNPTLANGKFMIVLPPSNYSQFKIEIFTTNHRYTKLTLQNESNVLIERSKVTPINITADQLHFENDPYVPSLFSVSEDRQVRFAKGNVYYDNGAWGMFDNQYDYYSTGLTSTHCDHFGRSLGQTNNYGITSDYNEIYSELCGESENFVDWGTLFPNYYGGGWRTLTHDELYYVTYDRRNAQNLFAYATVCGIEGLLLLPDEWVPVSGINLALGDNHYFYSNNIDATAWTRLENAGAVFLPCAGSIATEDRTMIVGGNSGNSETSESMIFGCYWCSDTQDAYYEWEGVRYPMEGFYSNSTFSFGFTSFADEEGDAGDHLMHRWYSTCQGVGNTVRLVQDAGWVSNSANGSAKGKRK